MSYTTTPNLGLLKPTVGGDDDAWGGHLNANADTLDTQTAAIYATGGATGITLLPQAFAARIWSPAAATQVLFSSKWVGPQRVVTGAGTTQISFSVQGELVKTWQDATPCYVPCEPGTWGQEYPPWTERVAA